MNERVLIVGGGHAAGQCAASLRSGGWQGEIVIAGEEAHPPYQRPPLSKAYLASDMSADRLFFKPPAFYDKENIDLRSSERAVSIDRTSKKVAFESGLALDYDWLVLATGARVRKLACAGADLPGVGYLRTLDDVDALKAQFRPGASLIIIGAGYIGLEVAASARKCGLNVTVFELADRVMARVTSPIVSHFFEGLHHSQGVDVRLREQIEGFEGEARVERVRLADGSVLPCDGAVVGVGVIPNDDIARAAGLDVNDGVVVDEFTRTADESIFAIGDCTRHPSRYGGDMIRLESVHNALEQAKTAAAAICGEPKPYDQAPWFWSDQYDVKLQTVGIRTDDVDAEIVRGSPVEKKFSVFYFRQNELVAVDSVNAPADHMIARRLIAAGKPLDPSKIAETDVDLKSLL